MKIAEQLGENVKPLFIMGALYTLPQTHGKTEFRLATPGDGQLPYVTNLREGTLKRLVGHYAHQYRVVEDQGDAFVLRLEDRSGEMSEDSAPEVVILRGVDVTRLRVAIASPERY